MNYGEHPGSTRPGTRAAVDRIRNSGYENRRARPALTQFARLMVAAIASLGLMTAIPGTAMAAAEKIPFKDGGTVLRVSPGGQKAVANGAPLAAAAVTCTTTGGAACAVTGVLLGMLTPIIEENAVCPNDEWLEVVIGIVDSGPNPPTIGSGVAITPWAVKSSKCVPA